MILAVKCSLLLLSMFGYILFLVRKFCVRAEFSPAICCAGISGLMFIGGVLNVMPEMTVVLFLGGVLLLVKYFKEGTRLTRREIIIGSGLLLALLWFSWLFSGSMLTHYDNFSHWATVVKVMLGNDRMPNFEDGVILFQSYPLGSALFIYFFCRIVGASDACLLLAQLIMLLSFLLCISVHVRRENKYGVIFLLLFGMWALTINVAVFDLLVDTLLPLSGVAAFSMIYFYKDCAGKLFLCVSPLLTFLLNVKNSGVFFYIICVFLILIYSGKYIRENRTRFMLSCFAVPLGTMFIWRKHVDLVFWNAMGSKHAMSLNNYRDIIAKKTMEDAVLIGKKVIKQAALWPGFWVLLFITFLCVLVFLNNVLRRHSKRGELLFLFLTWTIYGGYVFSLYVMYLFSMPLGEALDLASWDRYMYSIVVFMYGIIIIYLIDHMLLLRKPLLVLSVFSVICFTFISDRQIPALFQRQDYTQTDRYRFGSMLENAEAGDGAYFIYPITEGEYLYYMARYDLYPQKVTVASPQNFSERIEKAGTLDYLVIWTHDENTDQYLAEHNLTQYIGMDNVCVPLN